MIDGWDSNAVEQWNELGGRGQLFVVPERLYLRERIVDAEVIEMDSAIEIDPSAFGGGDIFKQIQEFLGVFQSGVIEDNLGGLAVFGFVAEGFLAGVCHFQAGFDGTLEELQAFGQVEEFRYVYFGELSLDGRASSVDSL